MESGNHKRRNSEMDSDDDKKSSQKKSVSSPAQSNSSKTSDSENTNEKSFRHIKEENSNKDTVELYKNKHYKWIQQRSKEDIQNNVEHGPVEHPHKFYLRLCNLPKKFTFDEIRDFINKEYEPVNTFFIAVNDDEDFIGMMKLEFDTYTECRKAYDKLNGKSIEDQEIVVDSWDSDDEYEKSRSLLSPPKKKIRLQTAPWRPDIDVFDEDPKGLYGFKPEFLASLGIRPPVGRWLYVSNFRCDKSELKEVFGLAGEVLTVYVDNRNPGHKFAYVVYSHPIEAVQAVGMLNNQTFYGQKLKVEIEKYPPGDTLLPKGLSGLGRGLGKNGKPLRDAVKQYERFSRCQSTLVDTCAFQKPNFMACPDFYENASPDTIHELEPDFSGSTNNSEQQPPGVDKADFMRESDWPMTNRSPGLSTPVGTFSPVPVSRPSPGPIVRPNFGPNIRMRQQNVLMQVPNVPMLAPNVPMQAPNVAMQPPNVPMQAPNVPMQVPNVPMQVPNVPMQRPMVGPRPGYNVPQNVMPVNQIPTIGPRPIGTMMTSTVMTPSVVNKDHVTVEISNLPLSTTFPELCEKMSACGQVMSLQLTAPGRARVQYAHKLQANMCFRQYNQCYVQGNIITVRFI